ncbi:hypothetical protein ABH935_004319 [Catenulispora sp. GAS73]|uniref:FG-GAP repeat domain-containing protein n=1 Tax=Catenulispora sp. GAS73 TaxID=3156269 RepID=UPI003516BEC4
MIRTPGTFTFSAPASSGVVEFDYVLNGSLSVLPGSNAHVAAGADGTATTPELRSARYNAFGDGLGGFSTGQEVVVPPPAGTTAWPAFTQLVSPGDLTGHRRADLIGKVGDQLFLYSSVVMNRYNAPVAIAGSGWSSRTVIGVVPAANGLHDLIARDDASGQIWRYPGQAGGTFGDETTRVLIGHGLTAKRFPLVITKGDANGDGLADIWAVDKRGNLFLLPGVAGSGFGHPQKVAEHKAWAGVTALG